MTPPEVSVVLVSWNSGASLARCLAALSRQSYPGFEVILIDNGSSDGSIAGLQARYPALPLQIEQYSANRGFAAACNSGVRLARSPWVALLNTDAFPEPDWLAHLLHAAEVSPGFTFFASRQIQANDHRFLDGAGDAYHVSGMAWRQYLGYPADRYGLDAREVFSSCAAAALYERQAFLEAGGFDEDFFSYLEDVDLGFRLRLQGHRCLFVPEAVVYHVGSASLGVGSEFALYHAHRNLIWSFVQNMPSGMLWRHLPSHVMANLIYLSYYSLQRPSKARAIWQAKWDAIRGLPRALMKRKGIQSRCRAEIAALELAMEHGPMTPYLLAYHSRRARHMHANPEVQ